MVQGTSGAFVSGDWETPQPAWSRYREGSSYGAWQGQAPCCSSHFTPHCTFSTPQLFYYRVAGYGKMRVLGGSQLHYQWISIDGKVLDDFTINKA